MGLRARQRIVSKKKYDEIGWFDSEAESLADFLYLYTNKSVVYDELAKRAYNTWEIYIDELKEIVQKIKDDFSDNEYVFEDWTATEVLFIFNRWIQLNEQNKDSLDNPDIIILDWM